LPKLFEFARETDEAIFLFDAQIAEYLARSFVQASSPFGTLQDHFGSRGCLARSRRLRLLTGRCRTAYNRAMDRSCSRDLV
jgi:hypothetical protein